MVVQGVTGMAGKRTMNRTLTQAAAAYLDDRYRHGFIPTNADNHVSSFASFSANRGHIRPMTADLCLRG